MKYSPTGNFLDQQLSQKSPNFNELINKVDLYAPGMPPPGEDFINYAELLTQGSSTNNIKEYIQYLYSLAQYTRFFDMTVTFKGSNYLVKFVPGNVWGSSNIVGPIKSKVMIIGKMPYLLESQRKLNLVGPIGELFKSILEELDFYEYNDWYITNLLKFTHPAPNQGGTIPTAWIKDCRPLLHHELRTVLPEYILCLGSEAIKEILNVQGKVINTAGRVFEYKIPIEFSPEGFTTKFHTAKVMTCTHPAAALRTPDLLPQIKATIKNFIRLINGEELGVAEDDIEHIIVDTEEAAVKWLKKIQEETTPFGVIAVDCEWQGTHPREPESWLRTIQISHKSKFALCIVLRKCGGEPCLINSDLVHVYLNQLFHTNDKRHINIVGHFLRADLPWLRHYGLNLDHLFDKSAIELISRYPHEPHLGAFDTGLAAHSVCEVDEFKLEIQATRYTTVPRYDVILQQAKKDLCKKLKIKIDSLPGYGDIPDDILHPYALYDVDATRRLYDIYNGVNGKKGLLDKDEYKQCSRQPFQIAMAATLAITEMEDNGILVDMNRANKLVQVFKDMSEEYITNLRKLINWPSFNPNSVFDCRELLFGKKYRRQINTKTGENKTNSPDDAFLCNLYPIKASGNKTKKSWKDLEESGNARKYNPATDKETLGILFHSTKDNEFINKIIETLRDFRFVQQVLRTTLRPPTIKDTGGEEEEEYEDGLLSYVQSDGRIRTNIYQTLETGRYSSARPNLQNASKRRESDYKRILKHRYLFPLRTIFCAPEGSVLIEADYLGAELAIMAWLADDPVMIEDVRRAQLPESSPDYYDIHSAIAVNAFRLNCPATKKGLESIGMLHLRVAAKNVIFGTAYGRQAEAIARQAKEEGVNITAEDAQILIDGIYDRYRKLEGFFSNCRKRVSSHGWLCNSFGRLRRFKPARDFQALGEQERQAMNFPVQSNVADAMTTALANLYNYKKQNNMKFKLLMQIHDAVLFEVPYNEVSEVYNHVIPHCMSELVPIYACDLNGNRLSDKVYNLQTDREIYKFWGEKLSKSELHKLLS